MKNFAAMLAIGVCLAVTSGISAEPSAPPVSYPALFDEICRLVEKHFYDPLCIRERFPALKKEYQGEIQALTTPAAFSARVNAMLKRLNASHTYYLTPHDYEYYQLAEVFSLHPAIQALFHHQEIRYPSVGIITETIDNRVFIAAVLSGSAAERAGLRLGDEILMMNGTPYQPIDSLRDHIGEPVIFTIKRTPAGQAQFFSLTPVLMNPKTEMLAAEKASIRVIAARGRKIGYIHIYSYAGVEYQAELVTAISWGGLKDADALIIDLRYGLGGADPAYLNIFNPHVPVMVSKDNTGKTTRYDPQWRKPAVYLVNKTSRSGKEILAYGAREFRLATVIGERTAGAGLGATLLPLSNGDLLYLAVNRIMIDGVDLEGIGVAPDIEVPMDIRYCEGKDVQLDRAIDYLIKKLHSS